MTSLLLLLLLSGRDGPTQARDDSGTRGSPTQARDVITCAPRCPVTGTCPANTCLWAETCPNGDFQPSTVSNYVCRSEDLHQGSCWANWDLVNDGGYGPVCGRYLQRFSYTNQLLTTSVNETVTFPGSTGAPGDPGGPPWMFEVYGMSTTGAPTAVSIKLQAGACWTDPPTYTGTCICALSNGGACSVVWNGCNVCAFNFTVPTTPIRVALTVNSGNPSGSHSIKVDLLAWPLTSFGAADSGTSEVAWGFVQARSAVSNGSQPYCGPTTTVSKTCP